MTAHRASQAHEDAGDIILRVISQGGRLTETNVELADALGIEEHRVQVARAHTQRTDCTHEFILAYRSSAGPGLAGPLGLIDPKASQSGLDSPEERATAMMLGQQTRRIQQVTEVAYMSQQWEGIADEAFAAGNRPLGLVCMKASAEVDDKGWVSTRTANRLAKLGVTV